MQQHRNITFSGVVLVMLGILLLSWVALAGHTLAPQYYEIDGETLLMKQEMIDGEFRPEDSLSRHRRYLMFRNNSLVQFTFAYSFPIELLPRRNLNIVLGGQIAYDLPFEFKKLTVQTISRNSPDISQSDVFRAAEAILDQSGIPGRACMLLTVCQLAETPFQRKFGLLEDIIQLLLSPSEGSHPDDWRSKNERQEYLEAEKIGNEDKTDCQTSYPECQLSLLEAFTKVMLS